MHALGTLRQLEIELGAEVFLAGGTVRDLVRNKPPNDLDVLVRRVNKEQFEDFLRARGTLHLVGKSFGVYLFQQKGLPDIEIAFPRTEVSTGPKHQDFQVITSPDISLEEDSCRRDFTCNSMYINIKHLDFRTGTFNIDHVIDFQGGLGHIKRHLLVAVGDPEKRIEEDPLRMLRAMVLIARTGYSLEGNTFGAIKRRASLIRSVAAERVGAELTKIMESDKPSRALKAMQRTGLLALVLPEVEDCVGCGQNPKYHSYPVFEHILCAADAACLLTERLDVRFAALCHDLGKAATRALRPNGSGPDDVSFHNHEVVSTHLTYAMLKRLKFPNEFIEQVVHLVRYHQYKYERTWTDKAVRKFIRNCGVTKEDLKDLNRHPQFLLRQADRMGNTLKMSLPITEKQLDFQSRLIKVYETSSAHSLLDLAINGRDVMDGFGLGPTPLIGRILKHLFEVVDEDPKANNSTQLLSIAEAFLASLTEAEKNELSNSNPRSNREDSGNTGEGERPREE